MELFDNVTKNKTIDINLSLFFDYYFDNNDRLILRQDKSQVIT